VFLSAVEHNLDISSRQLCLS